MIDINIRSVQEYVNSLPEEELLVILEIARTSMIEFDMEDAISDHLDIHPYYVRNIMRNLNDFLEETDEGK